MIKTAKQLKDLIRNLSRTMSADAQVLICPGTRLWLLFAVYAGYYKRHYQIERGLIRRLLFFVYLQNRPCSTPLLRCFYAKQPKGSTNYLGGERLQKKAVIRHGGGP